MPNTPNHNVLLPTVGASADVWGGENNDAHEFWDALTSGSQNSILGRVAAGAGPMKQLTAAEATSALNLFSTSAKGLVKASTAAEANRPLTGDGNFKKGIGRFAGARCVFSGNQVLGGVNISSATWTFTSGVYRIAVVFASAAANADYQVMLTAERSQSGPIDTADNPVVVSASRTVNGFTVECNYAQIAMHISVFEG